MKTQTLITARCGMIVLWLFCLAAMQKVSAQSVIGPALPKSATGYEGCLYTEINFHLKNPPAGYIKTVWDFGNGSKDTVMGNLTKHLYTVAGRYIVKAYPLNASNVLIGTVVVSDTVFINNLPTTNVVTTNGLKFCYPANVCFYDSSKTAVPLPGRPVCPIVTRTFLFGDGGQLTSTSPATNKNWCHLYIDRNYRLYTTLSFVYDKFGCGDTNRKVNHIYTVGDLGVQFAVNAPLGCAKPKPVFYTDATFVNQTNDPLNNPFANIHLTYPDSVKKFRWEFGDGAVDSVNWNGTTHRYTQNGTFSPRLVVEDINGCKDTFTITNGVRNVNFAFDVQAINKQVCANPGLACWTQTPVAGASKVWQFYIDPNPPYNDSVGGWPASGNWKPLSPDANVFQEKNSFTACRTVPCGLVRANLRITVPGCNDTTYAWDTVEVLGPDAVIEIAGSAATAIADAERYQCHVVNTVHFKNSSCHYKARNVVRLWDFGDKYARNCITDTKNNINVFGDDTLSLLDPVKYPPGPTRPCNCRYSKDSLPEHVYTDWDTLALRVVAGKTFINPAQEPYSSKNFPCYTAKLMLNDTVNKCSDADSVVLVFGPPKAGPGNAMSISPSGHTRVVFHGQTYSDPVMLKYTGRACLGAAPNGIIFDLGGLIPACTRALVSINYDSAAGTGPNKWVNQPGHFTALNNQKPWAIPPSPKVWPNTIAHNYFLPPGLADPNGKITIGLVAGNGNGSNMCYDTVWYHDFIRFTPFSSAWSIMDKDGAKEKTHYCNPAVLRGSINNDYQENILAILWNWNDGWVDIDSIIRPGYKPTPASPPATTYSRMRYTINPQGQITNTQNFSAIADTVIGIDTLAHVYTKAGRYFPMVTVTNTDGCQQFSVKEIVAGFFNQANVDDTVVCVGDEVHFRDSASYYFYPKPIMPPYELHYVGRDPLLGGYRQGSPQAPYQVEKIKWLIYKRDTVSGNNVQVDSMQGALPKYSFKSIGLYTIKMITTDSVGCTDTAFVKVTVGGVKAGVHLTKPIFTCTDTIRLFDNSQTIDPYFQAYGVRSDSIMDETQMGYYWTFGDGKTPSILKDPYHDYSTNGTFTVTHAVTNYSGCTDTTSATLQINGPLPSFNIVGSATGKAPFTATFDNTSLNSASYTWVWNYKGFQLNTNSDSNVSFTFLDPGLYCVYLLASDAVIGVPNSCPMRTFPDTLNPTTVKRCILVTDPVGMAKTKSINPKELQVFPNPTQNMLTVCSTDDMKNVEVLVLDMMGRKLGGFALQHNGSKEFTLPVQLLASGTYVLEIWQGSQVSRVRFVKK